MYDLYDQDIIFQYSPAGEKYESDRMYRLAGKLNLNATDGRRPNHWINLARAGRVILEGNAYPHIECPYM